MKKYNKLVRDKIPEIIEADSRRPITHIANDNEYRTMLKKKLLEEVDEFLEDESPEEMADILEVIKAIIKYKTYNALQIEEIRNKKESERWWFYNRVILDGIE